MSGTKLGIEGGCSDGGEKGGGGGDGGGADGDGGGELGGSGLEARSTGSHCGGQTTGWSTSASLLARQGFVVFGMKAAQKAAAAPMRTNARGLDACFFAYRLRSGGRRVRSGAWQVRGGRMSSWHGVCT